MSITLRCCQVQALVAMPVSIFPEVDKAMKGERGAAIRLVAKRKDTERYHSFLDFLICELLPAWREPCFRFYQGEGPRLDKCLTDVSKARMNGYLLTALQEALAYTKVTRPRFLTWKRFLARMDRHPK